MTEMQRLKTAIVGNDDQVALMRLAGVEEYVVIEENSEEEDNVKNAVDAFTKNPDIGIILIPERYAEYVGAIRYYLQEKRMTTPVIVEIPSGYESDGRDIKEYYKTLTKKLIGFTIEL